MESVQRQDGKIEQERQRQANWKTENERRRHNYVPVIFEVLKQLAQKRMLKTLFDEAKERKAKKQAEKENKAGSETKDVQMQQQ